MEPASSSAVSLPLSPSLSFSLSLRERLHRVHHPYLAVLENIAYGSYSVGRALVTFAYKNVKFILKHKVAQKREDAISKEVTRKLSEADNRKMSLKEKDERILWKKNEVADYEATTFSIFYNNTLFLVLVIVASFFILKNFNPKVNYILSISASSGLIALLSTGSK
uniref:Translocon-associated protein subunit gamma n=1 Tax=Canis lupus familiaris TaxID=9615 RepID=A0A8C0TI62_CANLF